MARKDEIFRSFLEHDMLQDKYELEHTDLPNSIREGLMSEIPIIKAIALIVDGLEGSTPVTDAALRNSVTQYLNEAI
jgi:hypothetical protein